MQNSNEKDPVAVLAELSSDAKAPTRSADNDYSAWNAQCRKDKRVSVPKSPPLTHQVFELPATKRKLIPREKSAPVDHPACAPKLPQISAREPVVISTITTCIPLTPDKYKRTVNRRIVNDLKFKRRVNSQHCRNSDIYIKSLISGDLMFSKQTRKQKAFRSRKSGLIQQNQLTCVKYYCGRVEE